MKIIRTVAFGVGVALVGCFAASAAVKPAARSVEADPGSDVANGFVEAVADGSLATFVAGRFTAIGPNGTAGALHAHVAAIDHQGRVLPAFAADTDNEVIDLAISPDARWLYLAGAFTKVDGVRRTHVARVDAVTGALDTGWNAVVRGAVNQVLPSGNLVYLAGMITSVGGQPRGKVAAVDSTTGAPTSFSVPIEGVVHALAIDSTTATLYIGGNFTKVGTATRRNLVAVSTGNGGLTFWNPTAQGVVHDVVLSEDARHLYSAGGGDNPDGNALVAYSTGLALTEWTARSDGDFYTVATRQGTVVGGGHFLYVGTEIRTRVASFDASNGTLQSWNPRLNSALGVRSVAMITGGVVLGGEFTKVNGVSRPYLARFLDVA